MAMLQTIRPFLRRVWGWLVPAREREGSVTLMAIKIVGLPQIAEKFPPAVVFAAIRDLHKEIARIVAAHGGAADEGYRDSFICRFEGAREQHHADRALLAAVTLQTKNLPRTLEATTRQEPVLALLVGLHSTRMLLGGMPGWRSKDPFLIGDGVSTATALMGSCDVHAVHFSKSTRDMLKGLDPRTPDFKPRVMYLHGETELLEAYEFDPFESQPALRRNAVAALRACGDMVRADHRFPLEDQRALAVRVAHVAAGVERGIGFGSLLNASKNGALLTLPSGVPVGSLVELALDSRDGSLRRRLELSGIGKVQAQVEWLKVKGAVHYHGLSYRNLTDAQRLVLLSLLLETQEDLQGSA
jgi:class 3 adenylate cyclase